MARKLKKGDSGYVPERVKEQLIANAANRCSAPGCGKILIEDGTPFGECAHIIPKSKDSHPRGLEEISEEDRNKEANLIYLCHKCHKKIDDPFHAKRYTVDVLQEWKQTHEANFAQPDYVPVSLNYKDMFAEVNSQLTKISKQAEITQSLIKGAISNHHELSHSPPVRDAISVNTNNAALIDKADLLDAMLTVDREEIPEAKNKLFKLIKVRPQNIEPMLEYIELCGSAPEPTDELEQVEKRARVLDKNHPHLLLIDLSRQYKNSEPIEDESIFDRRIDDARLRASLIRWHSLFCNAVGKTKQRDALVDKWQKAAPNSPDPHHYRVAYKTMDIRKDLTVQADSILDALEFSKQEWQSAKDKDPLTPRGHMSWLLEDLRLNILYFQKSGVDKDLSGIRDTMISRIDQCYFDSSVNAIVSEFLKHSPINPDQWQMIVGKIQNSNVAPSQDLIEGLFLHTLRYDELFDDLADFVKKYKHADLLKILQTIKDDNAPEAAKLINAKNNSEFALILLQAIADYKVAVPLAELLEIESDYQENFLALRLGIFDMNEQDEPALDLINNLNLADIAPFALFSIENISYRNQRWDLFIPTALHLLTFNISDGYKMQLHAKLTMVYFEQKDDTNAIIHAEQALNIPENPGEDNSSSILGAMVQALINKGMTDEACDKFQQYQHIKRAFGLLLLEADCYIKSSLDDKYNKAASLIVQAFEEVEVYEDKFYLPAFMLLVELSNAGVIPIENEPAVKDGLFIKLDGFLNWFYIGEEVKSLDAECIEPNTPNYTSVINKSVGDEISWPADKFSGREKNRRILQIAKAPSFLNQRAHEVMGNAAERGDKDIHTIRVLDDDGNFDVRKLEQFIEEKDKPRKDFFESYVNTLLPFSLLCNSQGSMESALGILQSEERGFIRCNDGSQADIDEQNIVANEVLSGAPCFIDGLVAVMLAESELLEDVIKAVPHLGVPTSVIGLLRGIAGQLKSTAGHVGRGRFVKGKFQFREVDKEKEKLLRDKLLSAADLLDALPKKAVGKTYSKSKESPDFETMLPDYFIDALNVAEEQQTHILTDDALLAFVYKTSKEITSPQHFSSINLIRAMVDNGKIDSQRYYEYFGFLSSYRYHGLPLSPNDMMRVVLPTVGGGLVDPTPQNISHLNLPLTLSQDYGVEAKAAVAVLVLFFTMLILNRSVTPQIADEIFTLTLAQALEKRDKKLMVKALRQGCHQNMLNQPWINPIRKKKLEMLDKRLVESGKD